MLPTASQNRMEMVIREQILPVLAPVIRHLISRSPRPLQLALEEIRIRQGKPLQVYTHQGDYYLDPEGQPIRLDHKAYRVTQEEVSQTIQLLTRSSLYALEEELRRGYLTIAGGHRVGLAGRTVLSSEGFVQTMKDITHLNIRIAREVPGVADSIKQHLINPAGYKLYNALIISPPQCGKTTLLRDIARQVSDGLLHPNLPGQKVGIVDERSELAGCVNGIPQHAVGSRTDVLDACPKAEGMLMMIRSMSPQLLITDEIGREADRDAILEAVHAGVAVIASAHGHNMAEVKKRPAIRSLIEEQVFSRYLVLSRRLGPVTLEAVYDKHGQCLHRREGRAEWSS
ncbi:stage III sporulation protein AA [Effusibacillus pohliae]|uniref:stage III sporulation protein AA n=1 Tax=Effusibacillus pohliae TaxID=232270 RepID=UPI0003800A1E|nr:stage III sporulation protein AA [Effusibacillus pohliae]